MVTHIHTPKKNLNITDAVHDLNVQPNMEIYVTVHDLNLQPDMYMYVAVHDLQSQALRKLKQVITISETLWT